MSDVTVLSIDMIVSNPKIRSGRPIIAGTTLRVQDIVAGYLYKGYSVADLVKHYPQINHAQAHAALAYYYAHQADIDAQLEEDAEFARKAKEEGAWTATSACTLMRVWR
jgi:uncharacterized protein (DUF433 family)